MEQLLTIKQVADYLQLSPSHLYKLVKQGVVPVLKTGMGKKVSLRFRREEIDAWLQRQAKKEVV